MSKKRVAAFSNIFFTLFVLALIGLTACEKYSYDPPVYEPPEATEVVYYGQQIAPLFEEYNCTGCHGGGISPDLRPANSFQELTGGGYINLENPEESSVVEKCVDYEHGEEWATEDVWLLLDWIYLGASDN